MPFDKNENPQAADPLYADRIRSQNSAINRCRNFFSTGPYFFARLPL